MSSLLEALARTHARLENFPEAATAYDRTIELDAGQLIARSERVILEERWRGFDTGQELARKLGSDLPDDVDATLLLADSQFRAKDYEGAVANYEIAWAQRPNSKLLTQYFRALERSSRNAEADPLLERWLEENPDDSAARFLLSSVKIRSGDYAAAITESERALEIQPNNSLFINNLAWLYDQQGEKDKALQLAERAYELNPTSPEIADTYGWMLLERGELTKALGLLRQANEGRPDNPEIGYHYAVSLNMTGNPREAKDILEDVIASDADFVGADEARELYQSLSN